MINYRGARRSVNYRSAFFLKLLLGIMTFVLFCFVLLCKLHMYAKNNWIHIHAGSLVFLKPFSNKTNFKNFLIVLKERFPLKQNGICKMYPIKNNGAHKK